MELQLILKKWCVISKSVGNFNFIKKGILQTDAFLINDKIQLVSSALCYKNLLLNWFITLEE